MASPDAFLLRFFSARNALFRRHQKELQALQKEFCQGSFMYNKGGYEEERILEISHLGNKAEITTNGYTTGAGACRLRYVLNDVENTWLVSDMEFECPICRGSGQARCVGPGCEVGSGVGATASETCRSCRGLGWISQKGAVDDY